MGGACFGPIGAVIGGASGFAGGFVGGCIYRCVKERAKYKEWKAPLYDAALLIKFKELFADDPRLRECEDPISHVLMTDPVRTRCGHIFHREGIESWLKRHPMCPLGCGEAREEDLLPDIGTFARITRIYTEIIRDGLAKLDGVKCSPEMKKAFVRIQKDLNKQVDVYMQNASDDLNDKFRKGLINREAFLRLTRDMHDTVSGN